MPDCGHRDAQCVVGNFYTCKTPGCSNGPESRTKLSGGPDPAWATALTRGISRFEKAYDGSFYKIARVDGWPYVVRSSVTDEVVVRMRCECFSGTGISKHCDSRASIAFGMLDLQAPYAEDFVANQLGEAVRQLLSSPRGTLITLRP